MYLLDTNVVSELRRPERADPRVIAWAKSIPPAKLFLSVMSVLELEQGILQMARHDPGQAEILQDWLHRLVIPAFGDRILPVDLTVARRYARLYVPDRRRERNDLITATSEAHRLTLVTRNVRDFPDTATLDPWAGR